MGGASGNRLYLQAAPPGLRLEVFQLAEPVVTCAEAAAAKCIALEHELKTLVLWTTLGYAALHVPGDAEASLRAVKRRLEVPEARLATPEELSSLGLSDGTVSAVLDPVWNMPHLISKRVLTLAFVSTNNGTLTGFFRFAPALLLEAVSVTRGSFERSSAGRRSDNEEL